MTKFLIKLFIKHSGDLQNPQVRQAYGTLGGTVGICMNILLFIAKLIAGFLTSSIAIMADAFNNLSDAGSSIVMLIGFKISNKPSNPQHPFGHGRVEYISGFVISLLIMLMGVELIKSSIEKIITPQLVEVSAISFWILIASVLVKLWMGWFNYKLGEMIQSTAMKATYLDSISDAIATTAVLIGIGVAYFTGALIDGYVGVVVAIFILYTGIKTAKESIGQLLGQAPDKELVREIRNLVLSHPEIVGMHDLIVHNYGPGRMMVSLHAEVPSNQDILQMHDVIDLIEMKLKHQFHCHATIHMDPLEIDDEFTKQLHELVTRLVTSIDDCLSIHDFRVVRGPSHTNLIFDVVTPHNYKIPASRLEHQIEKMIHDYDNTYFAVVQIETPYV